MEIARYRRKLNSVQWWRKLAIVFDRLQTGIKSFGIDMPSNLAHSVCVCVMNLRNFFLFCLVYGWWSYRLSSVVSSLSVLPPLHSIQFGNLNNDPNIRETHIHTRSIVRFIALSFNAFSSYEFQLCAFGTNNKALRAQKKRNRSIFWVHMWRWPRLLLGTRNGQSLEFLHWSRKGHMSHSNNGEYLLELWQRKWPSSEINIEDISF